MRGVSVPSGLGALALLPFALCLQAESPPNALLSGPEVQITATHIVQLMDSTAASVPGLARATEVLRQSVQTTAAALSKSLRDESLTLQLMNELRGYLALAESFPRPDFFPPSASQQFLALQDEQQRLDRHFQALLVRNQSDLRAAEADPNTLKRYGALNAKVTPPTPSLPRFVFIGDSVIDSWKLNEYFAGNDFVNRGISGQTTTQMLARFLADVVALRPLAVFVLAGSNDLAAGMTPSSVADNLVMMGDVAKAHSVEPVFASLLPVGGDAAKMRTPESIQKLNTWIRNFCIRENYVYVDYYTAMADSRGFMKADLSDDGVNPNARGYRVMAPILLDGVERVRELVASPADDLTKARRRGLSLR
ncbi:MAG TPA: GDSL-type esterase/lipase family protein [Bryobacteraceae bacterium]|nr:GDSL-type esterase/lipase family protein [Bryobacteraceae bacterium]